MSERLTAEGDDESETDASMYPSIDSVIEKLTVTVEAPILAVEIDHHAT
jgi:hypothetical protein